MTDDDDADATATAAAGDADTADDEARPGFLDLPELAGEEVGGAALTCNDEFFAARENLLKAHAPEWREHAYTDRGKWMDGWETRRRREPGHDWCVIRLGLPGVIHGVVVDTSYFRGNFPEACSLEACAIDEPLDVAALDGAAWTELIARSPLRGHHANRFAVAPGARATHLRFHIYPDGGVARLRVHGVVAPDWARLAARGLVDLAALEHGGWVESCSDMFFGSRNNLIKPGPSRSMADGWETRRRRGPGHDWALVRLGRPGVIEEVEVDTSHFKGNAPGRILIEACDASATAAASDARAAAATPSPADDDPRWRPLLATPVQPHTRHRFAAELRRVGRASHVRLSVFPCGGVARLRVHGWPEPVAAPGLAALDAAAPADALAALRRCCGSTRWAEAMCAARPFVDVATLHRRSERTWWALDPDDWLEAFAAHPRIGQQGGGAWSAREQSGAAAAGDDLKAELAAANAAYDAKFGFLYIVCASGRSAADMLADLRTRLEAPRDQELRTAAEEQCKITRLRLTRLLDELAPGASP